MKRIISLSIVLSTLVFASCSKTRLRGEGSVLSETRQVEAFTRVEANGSTDVEILPATSNSVVVTGYQNLIPAYDTRVSNGKLVLEFKRDYINVRNNNIKVTVYTTGISGIYLNGSGNYKVRTGIKTNSMNGEINGSGKISFDKNEFKEATYHINGSGEIDARSAEVENVTAKISGSGDIDLTATKTLSTKISGSGSIDYWGNPGSVSTDVDGSGKVRKN